MRHYRNIRAHLQEHGITESIPERVRTNDAEINNRAAAILTGAPARGRTGVKADAGALRIATDPDEPADDNRMSQMMSFDFAVISEDADEAGVDHRHDTIIGDAMKHLRLAIASLGLSTDTECTRIRGIIDEAYRDLGEHRARHTKE